MIKFQLISENALGLQPMPKHLPPHRHRVIRVFLRYLVEPAQFVVNLHFLNLVLRIDHIVTTEKLICQASSALVTRSDQTGRTLNAANRAWLLRRVGPSHCRVI